MTYLSEAIKKMYTEQNNFRKKYYVNPPVQPTSLEAKASVDVMTIMEKVICELKILRSTDDELEQRLDMRHQSVSAGRRECVKKGWVVTTGNVRPTRSGRNANVWELTQEGKEKARAILEKKQERN